MYYIPLVCARHCLRRMPCSNLRIHDITRNMIYIHVTSHIRHHTHLSLSLSCSPSFLLKATPIPYPSSPSVPLRWLSFLSLRFRLRKRSPAHARHCLSVEPFLLCFLSFIITFFVLLLFSYDETWMEHSLPYTMIFFFCRFCFIIHFEAPYKILYAFMYHIIYP